MSKFFLIFLFSTICLSLKLKLRQNSHFSKVKQHFEHLKKIQTFSPQQALELYHNDQQIESIIDKIVDKNPLFIKKQTCSTTPSYSYIVIDYPDYASMIRAQPMKPKEQVIITCNIHARELITTQICLQFLEHLSYQLNYSKSNYKEQQVNKQANLAFEKKYPEYQQILNVLQRIRLTVYYRGNDIRDKVIYEKQFCLRKDLNNIDINRNFPTNFNYYHVPTKSDQYPGEKPLSEPFSQCLDTYFQAHNPNVYIDIHSGQFTLYYEEVQNQQDNNKTYSLLDQVREKYCQQCRIAGEDKKDQNGKILDHSNGQIFSDAKIRYHANFSVLFQVFGGYNSQQSQNDNCFTIFNPLTKKQLDYHKQKWSRALMYFIKKAVLKQVFF